MLSSTQQASRVPDMTANTCSQQSPRPSNASQCNGSQRSLDSEVKQELSETEDEVDLDVVTTSGNEVTLSQTETMRSQAGCYQERSGDPDLDFEKVDSLMKDAYDATLIHSSGIDLSDVWYQHWSTIVHLQGKVYDLPGGAVGRKYVDSLSEEISHLSIGNFPADRVIVFSALMLQRDRMVKKSVDIRSILERRMSMWTLGHRRGLLLGHRRGLNYSCRRQSGVTRH